MGTCLSLPSILLTFFHQATLKATRLKARSPIESKPNRSLWLNGQGLSYTNSEQSESCSWNTADHHVVFDKEHNLTFLYNSADNRYNNGVKSKMEKRAESSELINNRETLRKAEMLEHWNSGKGKMKNKKREIRGEIEKEIWEK